MSPTFLMTGFGLFSQLLQAFGFEVSVDALNTTLNTLVTIGFAIAVLVRYVLKGYSTWFGKKTA